ncbi:hypothetical protein ACQWF9_25370, partial [Salmonella enterica subsp. enterica serovar Infantis]
YDHLFFGRVGVSLFFGFLLVSFVRTSLKSPAALGPPVSCVFLFGALFLILILFLLFFSSPYLISVSFSLSSFGVCFTISPPPPPPP